MTIEPDTGKRNWLGTKSGNAMWWVATKIRDRVRGVGLRSWANAENIVEPVAEAHPIILLPLTTTISCTGQAARQTIHFENADSPPARCQLDWLVSCCLFVFRLAGLMLWFQMTNSLCLPQSLQVKSSSFVPMFPNVGWLRAPVRFKLPLPQ